MSETLCYTLFNSFVNFAGGDVSTLLNYIYIEMSTSILIFFCSFSSLREVNNKSEHCTFYVSII